MNLRRTLAPLALLIVLAACGSASRSAPTATLASTPAPAEAAAPAAEAAVPSGKTPEGYNYLGSPSAPVTITTYSDFL